MQHQRLALAFAINNGYTNQLKVVLYSLLKHKKINTAYDIYLLAYQFNPENLASLEQVLKEHDVQGVCTLTYLPISDDDCQGIPLFKKVSFGGGWGRETIYRVLLPQYLSNVERVLYLDTDILIQDDLSDLLQVDLTNKAAAGVLDPLYLKTHDCLAMNNYRLAKLEGLSDEEYQRCFYQFGYINAGVLLMNLKYWRQEQITQQLITLLQRMYTQGSSYIPLPQEPFTAPLDPLPPTNPLYPDQDAINYLLARRDRQELSYLPNNYNISIWTFPENRLFSVEQWDVHTWLIHLKINAFVKEQQLIDSQPKIRHFIGLAKPWNDINHPFAKLYAQYAAAVGWVITYPNANPPKVNPLKKMIKGLLPYGLIRVIQVRKYGK